MAEETKQEANCTVDPTASAAKFIVPIGIICAFLFLLQMEGVLFLITIAFTLALAVKTVS